MGDEHPIITELKGALLPVYVVDQQPIYTGHATTGELLREQEVIAWRVASAEQEWGGTSQEAEVTRHLVASEQKAIRAELHRRELARTQPSAPRWPDAEPDKRAEWDEIKRRTNIMDLADRVIGGGIKRGPAQWFHCFAHEDKTPSLAVYGEPAPHFHCFSCGMHGDVIDLARHAMRLSSFQATMAILGEWAGINTRTITIQRGDETVEWET